VPGCRVVEVRDVSHRGFVQIHQQLHGKNQARDKVASAISQLYFACRVVVYVRSMAGARVNTTVLPGRFWSLAEEEGGGFEHRYCCRTCLLVVLTGIDRKQLATMPWPAITVHNMCSISVSDLCMHCPLQKPSQLDFSARF